ncbi:phospholipid-transporting ATPase 1-like [Dioscorea cayenensis subsp. rotundata]|uniref:Phospholipid-transporting ATPase n=1 Tax=Dioscorea cayennensis subsp. rotundata TaxID=55577 RepID=A0AB40BMS6_DIOCR|nr:phospholipid-transporting ATPase 1-like [Dioscorea cayenensis subsp. rotundata]
MASGRPLLIQSPKTPTSPEPPPPPLPLIPSKSQNTSISKHPSSSSPRHPPPPPPRFPSRRSDSITTSQRDIPDSEARFVYINDPTRSNSPTRLPTNSISTTKYSLLTFLPRNLFEQFHRLAYIYFLVLAAMNQVPQLGVFGRETSILPLAFVLSVTAIKDAYEDFRRHRSDQFENHRTCSVLSSDSQFLPTRWKDIRVGQLIKLHSNDPIPCDMLLLSTSDPTGVAYIQTVNLDGESNLKTRYAKQETLKSHSSSSTTTTFPTSGLVRCEKPNRNIYGFHANMDIDGKRVSLGPSNIVLRGCELKNTSWAIGVAVYTGRETKVMLNSSGAPSKRSRLEAHMNRETILLAVLLFLVCSIVTVLAGVWLHVHRAELDYMPFYRKGDYSDKEVGKYNYYGIGWEVVFTFLKSVIVFQVMIPIALYVSMELVRLGQAFFMIQDDSMRHEKKRFQCRALNINEDLGMIKYVFSDKTGTLTENKMEFRCASVLGTDYSNTLTTQEEEEDDVEENNNGYTLTEDGQILKPKMRVKIDEELVQLLRSGK